jgi:hypothetical protein
MMGNVCIKSKNFSIPQQILTLPPCPIVIKTYKTVGLAGPWGGGGVQRLHMEKQRERELVQAIFRKLAELIPKLVMELISSSESIRKNLEQLYL